MSIEVSPDLFRKMAGSSLTKDRSEADVEQEGRVNAYKTKVVLNLQGTSLTYFSRESSGIVASWLTRSRSRGLPVCLQTYDGHCVIVNPDQVPAMEVYDV